MTDTAPGPMIDITPEVTGFIRTWAESISTVLTRAAGATFTLDLLPSAPAEKPEADPRDLRLLVVSAGAVRGDMTFNFTASAVVGLGQLGLSQPQTRQRNISPSGAIPCWTYFARQPALPPERLPTNWAKCKFRPSPAKL